MEVVRKSPSLRPLRCLTAHMCSRKCPRRIPGVLRLLTIKLYVLQPATQDYKEGLWQNQISPVQQKNISRLISIEMTIDARFRWWHQRAECHIFCRWDWAAKRGLVANTIEECKHTEGQERPINGSSLGLINYLKKETEVWGHQRNLIRTRFITQSLYQHPIPLFSLFLFSCFFFLFKPICPRSSTWRHGWLFSCCLAEVKKEWELCYGDL